MSRAESFGLISRDLSELIVEYASDISAAGKNITLDEGKRSAIFVTRSEWIQKLRSVRDEIELLAERAL